MVCEVYIDGVFSGNCDEGTKFVDKIKNARRQNKIPTEINVKYDVHTNAVVIETAKGRAQRPLIIVKEGKPLLTKEHYTKLEKGEITFDDLIKEGIIEYLDSTEEEDILTAFDEDDLTNEHTHLEIHPITIMGLTASLVPYANFVQASRLNRGSKTQKQALGLYASNYLVRMDTDVNLLHNPHTPLVESVMHDISEFRNHPSGQNLTVAVISYDGYNMEDSLILNRGSVDRGMGRSTFFRPMSTIQLRYAGGLIDDIVVPDKEVRGYRSEKDYRYLEDDGIIYPEAKVSEEDVVIGKTSPPRFLNEMDDINLIQNVRRESSVAVRHGENGIVDMVLLTENEEGNKLIQVRIRDLRVPEIGDKYASRHGQKGVVGLVMDQSDMPFTASGITPDILFSPHGLPSRMTVSHLLELVCGKMGALSGKKINGTTFDSEPEKEIRRQLLELGFNEEGVETMYNGITGEQFKVKIYTGSMYYMKLKHMVANKMHARARGPVQLLTRQPTEGRAKEGGLRLGEMEKDTFVAHGASQLLKERFDSDRGVVPICEKCGLVAIDDKFKGRQYCPICGENVSISYVEIAYAFKLLLDEIKSLGVYPKLCLKDKF